MRLSDTFQQVADSLLATGQPTAFDSVWSSNIPTQPPSPLEAVMLADDKIFVVLTVVLIIWLGIVIFLLRTDKKIDRLERLVEDRISDEELL